MCLAIPARVVTVDGPEALVTIENVEYKASLLMLDNVQPGDYVMLHAGFAIQKIDQAEAELTLQLLNEVADNSKP
jgi:hydrogenase expression/formation protein HypC